MKNATLQMAGQLLYAAMLIVCIALGCVGEWTLVAWLIVGWIVAKTQSMLMGLPVISQSRAKPFLEF